MVKYVKEFKASAKNIATLLIDNFNIDVLEHNKKVQEALNLLEDQTYVERNSDIYEFLTDEEKDIEQEIKTTQINNSDVGDLLASIVFEEIIKDGKLRFEDNKNDYPFCRKMDDTLLSKEQPIAINVITPLNDRSTDENVLKANSMGRNELIVKIDNYLWIYIFTREQKSIFSKHTQQLSMKLLIKFFEAKELLIRKEEER